MPKKIKIIQNDSFFDEKWGLNRKGDFNNVKQPKSLPPKGTTTCMSSSSGNSRPFVIRNFKSDKWA